MEPFDGIYSVSETTCQLCQVYGHLVEATFHANIGLNLYEAWCHMMEVIMHAGLVTTYAVWAYLARGAGYTEAS